MSRTILRLKNVSKRIEGFSLQNIDISLKAGEVHVLMGENGSGKSLIMQIVSGFISADGGSIAYMGETFKGKKLQETLADNSIYIRQDATMLNMVSISENIFFTKLPYKSKFLRSIDYNKLNAMTRELIEEFNLPFGVFDQVNRLGLAQRQIAEICRAYISDASIVILDEPSAALTEHEKVILYKMIERIKARNAGIFYITHRLDEVLEIGDTITVIKDGKLIGTKRTKECTNRDIIAMLSSNYFTNRYPKLDVELGKQIYAISGLYHSNKLLDVSLELHKGEILGITGLAGSGRTLLANCMFGSTYYQRGSVSINGKPVSIKNAYTAIANGIALIPEDRLSESIFRYLDLFENIAFSSLKRFKQFLSINSNFLEQSVFDYIARLNIPTHTNANILEYSGGNQQKAIIAKWVMSRAKIFILDEPTRGVDNAAKIDIYNSIGDLVKKGAGVILISSDIEEIIGICDRVAVLACNTIVLNSPIKETTKEEIVEYSTKTMGESNAN
mgnify:CR=1 FL=1